MRTPHELWKAQQQIAAESKENICRELERIGREELFFSSPYFLITIQEDEPTKEEIQGISLHNGRIIHLLNIEDYEIQCSDVITSEWAYIYEMVEEECKDIPTAYYTEVAHHDRENNRLIYDLGEDIEETMVEGKAEAIEALRYNYTEYVADNTPLDYLPVFFLCVRENGQYRRIQAILSRSLAKAMNYTESEINDLLTKLNTPTKQL